jgi:hypothetical protein
MIRPLTTMVLCGVLGSMVLVGNAEACHRRNCCHKVTVCAAPAPVQCVVPAPCPPPVPCVIRTTCAPKIKLCCFKLPTFCHKKPICAPTPVCYTYAAPVSYPTATPQASAQH